MDKSWMNKHRLSKEYRLGVEAFLKYAIDHGNGTDTYDEEHPRRIFCPCRLCVNSENLEPSEVRAHLFVNGIDKKYKIWAEHGEQILNGDCTRSYSSNSDVQYEFESYDEFENYEDEMDLPDDAAETIEMLEAVRQEFTGDPDSFQKLIEDADKPLYPGCTSGHTKLSSLIKLYNMKAKGNWSDKSFSGVLKEFKSMLPANNELPESLYEAKKTLNALGMQYEKIHACPNDCVLFRKEYKDEQSCPICKASRWKENKQPSAVSKGVPAKVMWYFSPIPRFRRMFRSPGTSKNLTWHSLLRVKDGKLRHPANSPAWKLVDNKWPEFAKEPRNLRLGLSADGFNPNSSVGGNYSCWPVMLVVYNLPPSSCMKRKFIMLTMLISGPKQPGNDIDVYLAPLIEDLKKLWDEGVEVYDSYRNEKFNLKAVLLWTISDFPAYSNLCGCPKGGYKACPICAEGTSSIRLKYSQKNVYTSHRKFLPKGHKFRSEKKAFNGRQEFDSAPEPASGEEVFKQVEMIENLFGKKRKTIPPTYWKKRSIFFELEYWKYLLVRHCVDVMHVEKNVGESLVGTLLNIPKKTKDGYNARKDLGDLRIRPELEPQENGKRAYLPNACYTLTPEEKRKFCTTLSELKVPEGYCSNLRNRVSMSELKLHGLKSDDYHTIVQQFLPLAIRSILPEHVRNAIIRLCFFFKEICSKEVDVMRLTELQQDLVVTLCLLEKYFLPSFFDIMVHLTVHLIREVQLCGPVCFRWMYPFERFMKVMKGYIRNRNLVEGCIAENYIAEEAIEFCSEFFKGIVTIGIPTDRSAAAANNADATSLISKGKPLSKSKPTAVENSLLMRAHLVVLHNTNDVAPYIELHMSHLMKEFPLQSESWLLKEHNRTFIDWLCTKVKEELRDPNNNISDELQSIACGPSPEIFKCEGYEVSGCVYHTKTREAKRVYQNSGVSVVDGEENTYYGVIDEIWLLDYYLIRVPVFKCDWVHYRGIEKDKLGFISVDFGRLGYKDDPFIMASHAKQVFYVRDQNHSRPNSKWSVVMSTREKDPSDEEALNDSLALEGNPTFNNVVPDEGSADVGDDSQSAYVRDSSDGVWIADITKEQNKKRKRSSPVENDDPMDDSSVDEDGSSSGDESSLEIDSDED